MPGAERLAYSVSRNSSGESVLLPPLPIVLRLGEKLVAAVLWLGCTGDG